MSSLNQKLSSLSNPFNISSDSFKFSLDHNHSIPDIMNTNNEHIMIETNAFIPNNTCNFPVSETIGEKKLGGEPLKQYFNVLADATDGINVLPLPEKVVTYGVVNLAYGENSCLSTPKTKVTQIPVLSNPSTVNTILSSTPLVYQSYNKLPPSPISPKFTTLNINSPYVDSNINLTHEISTPTSSLAINNNSNIMASIQQPLQNKYVVVQQPPPHPQESTCFYARRKQELKNVSSSIISTTSLSNVQNVAFNDPSKLLIPKQENVNNVIISNQQNQIPLEQTQQTNIQTGNSAIWDSANASNIICTNNTTCIPQFIVPSNSSIQNIIVQQPTQQVVYQPSIINNINTSGLLVQQQPSKPHQQVVVQSQVPAIASTSVAVDVNSPVFENSVSVSNQPSPQTISNQNTVQQQMVIQLQPIQNATTTVTPAVICSSIENTPIIQDIVYSPCNNNSSPSPTIKKENDDSSFKNLEINIKKEEDFSSPTDLANSIEKDLTLKQESDWNSPNILTNNSKNESSVVTPATSPDVEVPKSKKKETIIINLSDFKPISSHFDNYKNNKPAVLKCIHKRNHDILKKKYTTTKIRRNSSSLYKCDICQKEYPKYYQLKSHLIIHMTDKPFKCDYCKRSFCRKNDLVRHLRIHTGDTPFFCSVCFKGFARSDACTRHVRQNLCKRNVVNFNPETGDMEIAI